MARKVKQGPPLSPGLSALQFLKSTRCQRAAYIITMEHQDGHQTLAPVFIAVDTTCFTFSTAAVLARLVTRLYIKPGSFGFDDATIVLAQVSRLLSSHDA